MKSFLQDAIKRQESVCFTGPDEGWVTRCDPVNAGDVFPAGEPRGTEFDEYDHFGTKVQLGEGGPEEDHLWVLIPEDKLDFLSEVTITPFSDDRNPVSIYAEEDALYRFAQLVVAAIEAKRNAHSS